MDRKGFTLVEILIAAALVPFIAIALYSNFSAGSRLWGTLRKNMPAEQADIFFYKAAGDLESAFKTALFAFEGADSKISFASFSDLDPNFGGPDGIARVSYFFDKRKSLILRETQNASEIFRSKAGPEKAVFTEARSFRIEYFGEDPLTHRFAGTAEWRREDGSLPAAVRFAVGSDASGKKVFWTRTFHVPSGS